MKKRFLIIAIILVVVGIALLVGALIGTGLDFSKFGAETSTYTIEGSFTKIEINEEETDVSFARSEDGTCKVVVSEREKVKHTAVVEDGILKIALEDARSWLDHITLFSKSLSMVVYLPYDAYEALSIKSITSDVRIPAGFSFDELAIKLSTGNIDIDDATAKKIDLTVTTGKIRLKNTACEGEIALKVSTGNANLTDVTCKALTSTGSTGNLTLTNVVATESFDLERSTGNVHFESCDAEAITVKTSTGKVTGSLQSDKIFITKTSTGSINIPETTSGGVCKITTSTGKIEIRIER